MSMQLFSFGHPCEHQLRRTCIGGTSCPLNGYPDVWCCSYIKGKINFKRDKPCEGPRCRWGFTHPSQQQFDEVTQVLNDSRPVAAKIDDTEDTDLLNFNIESPHIVDTVQCALHMLRHPPSSCAQRVGQLMAYGAVKAGDPKVFLQLLKTMKKPVDNYILGAFLFLTQGTPPNPTAGPNSNHITSAASPGGKGGKKAKADIPRKEDVVQELRNDLVDIMGAALSHGGHLVDRADQHLLQATFLQALRHYPKGNKKRQEMLEAATQCFGNRQPSKESPPAQTAKTAPAAATPASAAEAAVAATATTEAPSAATPASNTRPAATTPATGHEASKSRTSPPLTAATTATATATATAATPARSPPAAPPLSLNRLPTLAEVAAASSGKGTAHHHSMSTPPATAEAAATSSPAPAPASTPASPVATAATQATPRAPTAPLTISRIALLHPRIPRPLTYDPLRVDEPLPNVFLAGGLFALSPHSTGVAPLGAASVRVRPPTVAMSPDHSAAAPASSTGAATMESALHHALFGVAEPVFENFDAEKLFAPADEEWGN